MPAAIAREQNQYFQLVTIFELSLYALVGLSSLMLAISEGFETGPPPQSFTIPLLIVAFLIVDHWRLWCLPWWGAGVCGMLALVGAFWDVPEYLSFSKGIPVLPEERRLDLIFAGAHLLVYLTWIVMFLRKTNQQYWWLWALAVLQISVGASQSTESIYGILLSVYLFLALWTLSVFSLYQGQQQFDRAERVAESMAHLEGESRSQKVHHETPANRARGLSFWNQPSNAVGSVQRDPNAAWINLRFLGGVLGTASVAFFVAILFFFLIPRHPAIWRRTQQFQNKREEAVVGFSRNLSLGDIGQILESTKKVMEVRLTDAQTGETLDIEKYADEMGYEEPLFRGMTTIEYRGGQWKTWRPDRSSAGAELFLPGLLSPRGALVKQQIHLEAVDSELLFAMPPARYGAMENNTDPITFERFNDILKRPDRNETNATADYAILSPRFAEKPGSIVVRSVQARFIHALREEFLKIPIELERLRDLARQKAGFDEQPRPSPVEMARRLQDFLKHSGEFTYTLNANVSDPKIDPLEDFLFNRKQGHCEYFASVLALMLRSVGVPSRLVSGFKGGDYHQRSGTFVVEERHAHAWVEAFIDDSWVIFDPTPASRAESVASVAESQGGWRDLRAIFREFWTRFVVNLSVGEQRRLLEPLKQLVNDLVAWLRNGRGHLKSFVNGLKQQLQSPERWISWQGGLVTFVLLSVLSAIVWIGRALWKLFLKLRSQYFDPQGLARTVAFYERFRKICSTQGWRRKAAQTPKEFAFEVRKRMTNQFPEWVEKDFPLILIEAYYEVRYGGQEPSSERMDQLEQDLSQFEALLQQPR